jgi:hypothetical protein
VLSPAGALASPVTRRCPAQPRQSGIAVVLTTAMSSLKERAGVKRGLACGFAAVAGFAGQGGMASRRGFP